MAKATTRIEKTIPDPAVEQAQAIGQILKTLADNKESLLMFMDIIKELHEWGVLEAVHAMLKNRHEIGVIGITQLNKPGAHHIMKNGMHLLQFLSRIEPAELGTMLNGVAAGVKHAAESESDHPLGVWGMMKTMRDPEVGASLNMMFNFLRGMGNGISNEVH